MFSSYSCVEVVLMIIRDLIRENRARLQDTSSKMNLLLLNISKRGFRINIPYLNNMLIHEEGVLYGAHYF